MLIAAAVAVDSCCCVHARTLMNISCVLSVCALLDRLYAYIYVCVQTPPLLVPMA
jgi:hypothetical protein